MWCVTWIKNACMELILFYHGIEDNRFFFREVCRAGSVPVFTQWYCFPNLHWAHNKPLGKECCGGLRPVHQGGFIHPPWWWPIPSFFQYKLKPMPNLLWLINLFFSGRPPGQHCLLWPPQEGERTPQWQGHWKWRWGWGWGQRTPQWQGHWKWRWGWGGKWSRWKVHYEGWSPVLVRQCGVQLLWA